MKDGKYTEILIQFLKITGHFQEQGSRQANKRKRKPMVPSVAGKRDIHLVLLYSRLALYSVSVNSQDFRASTCTV